MKFGKLFLIGIFIIPLLSCEDPDSNFETNAELLVDVALNTRPLGFHTKSNVQEMYFFEGSKVFCLANKNNLQNCPGSILGISPGGGATLSLSELENHSEIHSLKLLWGHAPFNSFSYNMHEAVPIISESKQSVDGEFIVNIDELLQPIIGKMNENPRSYIFIMLVGESTMGKTINAQLKIPVVVKSEIVSPHFSL